MLIDRQRILFSTVFAAVMCATAVVSAPGLATADACVCSVAPWSSPPLLAEVLADAPEPILWCENGDDPRCASDDGGQTVESRTSLSASVDTEDFMLEVNERIRPHTPYEVTVPLGVLSRVDKPPQHH